MAGDIHPNALWNDAVGWYLPGCGNPEAMPGLGPMAVPKEPHKMGPVEYVKDVLRCCETAFRERDLVKPDDECNICFRMLDKGTHASDCPYPRISIALQHLEALQKQFKE